MKQKAILNIKRTAVKKGIHNPHQLHLETGISVPRINKMWASKSPVLRLEDIEVLCETLNCKVQDIIQLVPTSRDKSSYSDFEQRLKV